MKLTKSQPINCHIFRDGTHSPELKEAWLLEQTLFPQYKFYVTENTIVINDREMKGYTLTEYSTGMNMAGYYPDKTKPAAAKWLQLRVDKYGIERISALIENHIKEYGTLNN